MPTLFNVPTLSILAPTLLDFGTEEQKQRHIPAILRGEELWVQFLSEPSGGSDLAGLVTRATRDGDIFVLNGSKIWSSGAFRSDYAMCLARTDGSLPKHQGLTMFILKIHQPGIEVQRITMVNELAEFCQEFFDDVEVPVADVVGEINDGWTVASRLLYPRARGGGRWLALCEWVGGRGGRSGGLRSDLINLARATGQDDDPIVRQLVAEARVNDRVGQQLLRPGHHRHPHRRVSGAGGSHPQVVRLHQHRAALRHRTGDRRARHRGLGRGRPRRLGRQAVPGPSERQPGRREQRDGPQHHQRAGAGDAEGVRRRP